MVSSGTVTSHLSEVKSNFTNYNNTVSDLSGNWKGASYNNLKNKAEEFSTEYSSVIDNQMNSFASACDLYEQYINTKNELSSAQSAYNSASSSGGDASYYQSEISRLTAEVSRLKQKIESTLSGISQTLEGASSSTLGGLSLSGGDIEYKTTRFANTTVWYAVIPKDRMPQMAVAHDNYDKLGSEAPSKMAQRKNAVLGINFCLTGSGSGMLYANGKILRGNDGNTGEVLFMTQDGQLNSVSNTRYSPQQLVNTFNPVWASTGFYAIARDGHYVSWNTDLARASHPRTFIGQDYDGNYIVGVCTGRRSNEKGMTLKEVYDFITTEVSDNLRFLYNADGGGSSAFVYKGEKLNPNTDKSERSRPDLIYWT